MTDQQLLTSHLQGDPQAFATLTQKYIDLVHAAAFRQSPANADDITQAVFLLLSQKAKTLQARASIAGWLILTARLCAGHARRADLRRKTHEREASMQSQSISTTEGKENLLPLLDEAIAELPGTDRDILVLRHLKNMPLEEISASFNLSVPAATKRAQRALEKLRQWFSRRGHKVGVAALTATLTLAAAHKAPAALASAATTTSAAALTKSLIVATTLKSAAAIFIIVLLAAALITTAVKLPIWSTTRISAPVAATEPDESSVPGETYVASYDLLMDTAAAEALRKSGNLKPLDATTHLYQAYRVPSSLLMQSLRAVQEADQLIPSRDNNVNFDPDPSRPEIELDRFLHYNNNFQLRRLPSSVYGYSDVFDAFFNASSIRRSGKQVLIQFTFSCTCEVNDNTPPQKIADRVHYDGPLNPGESFLFLGDMHGPAANPVTHAIVLQAFRCTAAQYEKIRLIRAASAWIEWDIPGARRVADQATVYRQAAIGKSSEVPDVFVHKLPNNVTVRLVAVSHPHELPFCWWKGDGTPLPDDWTERAQISVDSSAAVVFDVDTPQQKKDHVPPAELIWTIKDSQQPLRVGVSFEPWTDVGTLPVRGKGEFHNDQFSLRLNRIVPLGEDQSTGIYPVYALKAPSELDVRVVAVDKDGRRFNEGYDPDHLTKLNVTNDWNPAAKSEQFSPNIHKIKLADVDHLEIQTRPRYWTEFEEFAEQPTTLPSSK